MRLPTFRRRRPRRSPIVVREEPVGPMPGPRAYDPAMQRASGQLTFGEMREMALDAYGCPRPAPLLPVPEWLRPGATDYVRVPPLLGWPR